MFITILSWMWMFISTYTIGFAGLCVLNWRSVFRKRSLDVILVFGLCFLTVYAQIFSLFTSVGKWANIILCILVIAFLILFRNSFMLSWKESIYKIKDSKVKYFIALCLIGVIVLLVALILTRGALHYDTYLYHAQSIRWIEEYGVVPGLGNLHNRLAYNSSFFALQSLFSFRFICNSSLFGVNGFVVIIMLGYTICSFKALRKKVCVSDFFRVGILLFFLNPENYMVIGSPGTDILTLTLVCWILVKWVSYLEEACQHVEPYAELCVLAVYAISVKLSSAMIVLLVLTPAIWLLKEKRWLDIAKYMLCGLLIISPWLIRNVIISGYLIYPYPELDIFTVDWKMPEYTLLFDRNEIKTWGWGLNDVYQFNAALFQWFPVWYDKLTWNMQALFWLNVTLVPITCVLGIYKGIRNKDWRMLQVVGVITALLILWFVGSPLPRYGIVYMSMLPLMSIGCLITKMKKSSFSYVLLSVSALMFLCISWSWFLFGKQGNLWKNYELFSAPYITVECVEIPFEDMSVFVPAAGDQAGYYAFPSTPYAKRLQLIELRGTSFEEGFRMKREYQRDSVTTYGDIDEVNIFEQ